MHLKMSHLQSVVDAAVKEEKTLRNFRDELFRVFGPPIMVSESTIEVAKAANQQLDALESSGRSGALDSLALDSLFEAAKSRHTEVRRIAVRLLPEQYIKRFLSDKSSSVRCAAARRLPFRLVKESVRSFPGDETLRMIAQEKRISESGIPQPKEKAEPLDIHGDERLGDSVKGFDDFDHTIGWYDRLARDFCKMYGTNIEGNWEEVLVSNYCRAMHASSGIVLDKEKLLKAVMNCIEQREEKVLKENYLRDIAKRLREGVVTENFLPAISLEENPIEKLLSQSSNSTLFLQEADQYFNIRFSELPRSLKKYALTESVSTAKIPVKAVLPGRKLGTLEEKALDLYVDHWNRRQQLAGEPFRLSWSPHPSSIDLVGFNLELK